MRGSRGPLPAASEAWGARGPARAARAYSREVLPQPARVVGREGLPVVVEVGEDLGAPAPRGDPALPHVQLAPRVVPAPSTPPPVHADEGPVGRHLVRLKGPLGVVADDERRARASQELVYLRREPARVAKLEGVAVAARQQLERLRQALVVAVEGLGKLPQQRPQLPRFGERVEEPAEALDPGPEVTQALYVREVAAHLDREDEPRRGALRPALHGRR